jgi:predicted small metal-binding protein
VKRATCNCGFVARDESVDAVVDAMQQHVLESHWTEADREDVLELIEDEAGADPQRPSW